MCGIFGYCGTKNNAAQMVLNGLKLLEYRGYDSWGVAALSATKAGLLIEKHTGKIGTATLRTTQPTSYAIGHTRWATHGGVTEANAHPHLDQSGKVALVHNGIIENYQELRDALLAQGYSFRSETDSEVGVQLMSSYLEEFGFREAVRRAFLEVRGLNAWVALHIASGQIVAARRGSPLVMGVDRTGMYVASDASALTEYTSQAYFLEEDDFVVWEGNRPVLYDVTSLQEKRIHWQKLDITAEDLSLGDSADYMIKEIHEQPKVLQALLDTSIPAIKSYTEKAVGDQVFVGCGSAYHAALTATYFLALIAGEKATAVSGSEFSYFHSSLMKESFITFLSQSGETIDLLESVRALQSEQIGFGAIVNRLGSSLERSTPIKIVLGAGPEQCVLATKSFTAKLATTFLLAHARSNSIDQGKTELAATVQEAKRVLSAEYTQRRILPLAESIKESAHLFILGRGMSYPVALEAALKIKEVTYIHTEGFAAGELKHGVIALIEQGTPSIVFAPADETHGAMISTAMEIKSRGAYVIGVSDQPNEVFDYHLPLRTTGLSSAITQSIVIQLLAHQLALLLGRDPDKPRNLAKSVTVK